MIFKQAKRRSYTILSNDCLRDQKLSFKATGLLAFLLSLPPEWKPNSKHLAGIKTDGRDSVQAGLRELEAAGYLHRHRIINANGTFDWVIEVYEAPTSMAGFSGHGGPETNTPQPGSPATGHPATENPASKESLRSTDDELLSSESDCSSSCSADFDEDDDGVVPIMLAEMRSKLKKVSA